MFYAIVALFTPFIALTVFLALATHLITFSSLLTALAK